MLLSRQTWEKGEVLKARNKEMKAQALALRSVMKIPRFMIRKQKCTICTFHKYDSTKFEAYS